ncbi:MAG: hypothetical protein FD174_1653 [Geobacteraceae bacterium]|nr:MAG: hypothetical protein FD174_1653 [Geobacteraceae bacterium]
MSIVFIIGTFIVLLGAGIYGTTMDKFAIWKFVLFSVPLLTYIIVMFSSRDRLRFILLSLIIFLPFIGLKIPPGSLGLTVFDVLMFFTFFLLLAEKLGAKREIVLIPTHHDWFPLFLLIPSALTSISYFNSLGSLISIGEIYLAYVLLVNFVSEKEFIERLHLNLAFALIIVCLFVLLEKATGINFNYGAAHSGQYMQVDKYVVHRTAGIFQDPQKAAQFIGVIMTYLIVVNCRKTFQNSFYMLVSNVAIALSIPALFITVSRAAIFGSMAVSAVFFLFFNKAGLVGKLFMGCALCLVLVFGWLAGGKDVVLSKVLPASTLRRLEKSSDDIQGRTRVWEDSWRVFKSSPLTGIGPGNYREFFFQENPNLREFFAHGGFVPDMPESGYLKILYEVGIIGSIGCIYFFFRFMGTAAGNFIIQADKHLVSLCIASIAAMLVFLATFITIFTVSDKRNAMIVPLLAAIVFAGSGRPKTPMGAVNGVRSL